MRRNILQTVEKVTSCFQVLGGTHGLGLFDQSEMLLDRGLFV